MKDKELREKCYRLKTDADHLHKKVHDVEKELGALIIDMTNNETSLRKAEEDRIWGTIQLITSRFDDLVEYLGLEHKEHFVKKKE